MVRLSRKFIKRAVIGLVLLAPIVYLFGTQLASLNGAHGIDLIDSGSASSQTDFFVTGNVVEQWGQDVLSASSHGFAPIAELFKYVDANLLHLGDLQVGKMAYGYAYYSAHVLIFMLLYEIGTFFISWIRHIVNKFGGENDD